LFIGAMAIAPYTVYVGDVWVCFGGGEFGLEGRNIGSLHIALCVAIAIG